MDDYPEYIGCNNCYSCCVKNGSTPCITENKSYFRNIEKGLYYKSFNRHNNIKNNKNIKKYMNNVDILVYDIMLSILIDNRNNDKKCKELINIYINLLFLYDYTNDDFNNLLKEIFYENDIDEIISLLSFDININYLLKELKKMNIEISDWIPKKYNKSIFSEKKYMSTIGKMILSNHI